jgi:peptidoglycan/LPS O-acetylase OafA/YrhL
MATSTRHPGLDTLRAAAIVLVLLYHYQVFVSRDSTFGWLGDVGWVGVDLFFVLSGYLIANGLFAGIARGQALSASAFYARRALRTLPLFWLVLAAYLLWPADLGGRTPPPAWRFLTFTQNWNLQPGTSFSHAWSLCIEEQFYLVLPLVLLAGAALRRQLRWGVAQGWVLMALLWALGIGARAWLWQAHGLDSGATGTRSYHPAIYYATLCRFDEFLPGVALAMLKHFQPAAWARVTARGAWVQTLALGATGAVLWGAATHYYIDGVGYGFFMTAFGYSLLAVAFALLVLAALCPGAALQRWRVPGAAPLALWSYAIYLSHKAVAHMLHQQVPALADAGAPLVIAALMTACVAVGWLLHRLVEAPFLALRDKHVPQVFAQLPQGAVAGSESQVLPDAGTARTAR